MSTYGAVWVYALFAISWMQSILKTAPLFTLAWTYLTWIETGAERNQPPCMQDP